MIVLYGFRLGADVVPAHRPAPAGRHEQAAEHPYGGRFPRPVRSEKAEDLPLRHLEADLVHGNETAEGAAELVYLDGLFGWLHQRSFSAPLFLSCHEGDKDVFERRQDRPSSPQPRCRGEAMAATTASATPASSRPTCSLSPYVVTLLTPGTPAATSRACRPARVSISIMGKWSILLTCRGLARNQELSLVDEPDLRAPLRLVEVGRGDEDRHPFPQEVIEYPPEVPARHGIDAARRLVEEEDLGRVDERAGETQLLFHASRQIARETVLERGEVAESEESLDPGRSLLFRHPVKVRVEEDVFHHGQVFVEAEPLGHVADPFLDRLRVVQDRMARHPCLSAGRQQQAGKEPHDGGFPRAVRSDKPEKLPWRDLEVEMVDGHVVAEGLCQA